MGQRNELRGIQSPRPPETITTEQPTSTLG